jgi:putative Mg2+ transporter-C (MgtC) family protein
MTATLPIAELDAAWFLHVLAWFGEMLLRLLLAGGCGALIGWQREKKDKSAGLRTHMLLALGSCTFTLVGLGMEEGDIIRVVQGTLMGTGFICGGVIFREGPTVRGLTTAVGLWSLSAIGVAAGAGEYSLALLATLAAFVIMAGFVKVEEKIEPDTRDQSVPMQGGPDADEDDEAS